MSKKDTTLPNELGTARLVGKFESNSPEWHELRKTGIGGSDVASIVGLSPWTSPFALWAKKTGRIDDSISPSEAAEWGTILEPVILDQFAKRYPDLEILRDVGTWAHSERPWQLANPDAIYRDKDGNYGIVEIKTSRYEDDWVNGVPAYYKTQVQWYAQTFGFQTTIYVVALFAGSKFRVYEIAADPFEQEINLKAATEFLTYIAEDSQPDYDGALSTYETIREIHPEIDDSDADLGDLYSTYALALEDERRATEHANEMRSRVLDFMGKAKRGLFDGRVVVTRQARKGGSPYLVNKKG